MHFLADAAQGSGAAGASLKQGSTQGRAETGAADRHVLTDKVQAGRNAVAAPAYWRNRCGGPCIIAWQMQVQRQHQNHDLVVDHS